MANWVALALYVTSILISLGLLQCFSSAVRSVASRFIPHDSFFAGVLLANYYEGFLQDEDWSSDEDWSCCCCSFNWLKVIILVISYSILSVLQIFCLIPIILLLCICRCRGTAPETGPQPANHDGISLTAADSAAEIRKTTQGSWTTATGESYRGEIRHITEQGRSTEQAHGHGKHIWADATYVGQFYDEKMHGQGTMDYANGDTYVGHWQHGLRHGEGVQSVGQASDGEVAFSASDNPWAHCRIVGEWKDGKPFTCFVTSELGAIVSEIKLRDGTLDSAKVSSPDGSLLEQTEKLNNGHFSTAWRVSGDVATGESLLSLLSLGEGSFVKKRGRHDNEDRN